MVGARLVAGVTGILLIGGCSSSTGDDPSTTPAMAVTVSAPTIELAQGSAQLGVVSVTSSTGLAPNVTITVDRVASKVRGLISSVESGGDGTNALLAVGSDTDAVPGTYHMVVHATAPGVAEATGAVDIALVPAGTRGYSFEVRPVSVAQGATTTTSISIIRANDIGLAVAMTMDSVPNGVDVQIIPAENARELSTLTVTASTSARPGRYTMMLHGVADALGDRVAMIPLTVVRGR